MTPMMHDNQVIAIRMSSPAFRLVGTYLILAVTVLWIPWLVPVAPVRSDSYALGFSNLAFVGGVVFLYIVPVFFLFRAGDAFAGSARPPAPGMHASDELTLGWLRRRALFWFAGCAVFILLFSYNLAGYGEAEYFLLRSALVEAGKVPYTDFEYAYGPVLLYAAVLLNRVGFPAGLSQALLVIAESVIGYLALYYLTSRVFEKAAAKLMFFAVFLATCLSLLLIGQNYTFFRFAAAIAVACHFIVKLNSQRAEIHSVLAGPIFLLGWAISPEIGVAAGGAYGMLVTLLSKHRALAGLGGCASMILSAWLVPLGLPSFETAIQFSGGGNNLPAFPSFHILLFLFSVYLATAYISRKPLETHRAEWLLFIYSVGLLPGALGRCDPLHVVFYGFGFLLLAGKFALENELVGGFFRKLCVTFGVAFFLIFVISYAVLHSVPMGAIMVRTTIALLSDEPIVGRTYQLPDSFREKAELFRNADAKNTQLLRSKRQDIYVVNSRSDMAGFARAQMPYSATVANATTAAAFDRLAHELKGKTVLIPDDLMLDLCRPYRFSTKLWSVLFLSPTQLYSTKNDANIVAQNLCRVLKNATVVTKGRPGEFTELQVRN